MHLVAAVASFFVCFGGGCFSPGVEGKTDGSENEMLGGKK